jgi:hypothetical protein
VTEKKKAAVRTADVYARARTHVRENQIAPNKLLEVTDGKRLDVGAATPARRADSQLEAVGAIDGTKDEGR